MKTMTAAVLLAAGTMLAAAAPASAFTGAAGIATAKARTSAVTDVGWRCGRGWHWSFYRHRCVPNWRWRR